MSLQAQVLKNHHMCRYEVNVLVKLVYTTWENGTLDKSIQNLFSQIQKVLCSVVKGGKSKELVETKCRKNYKYG